MDGELLPDKRPETLPVASDPSPMQLIQRAIDAGTDVAALVTLSELAKEWEDRRNRQEFSRALAQFQIRCPTILKTKGGPAVTRGGSERMYHYAPLDEITRKVNPILHDLGLAYSWDTTDLDGLKTVTCTLRHVNGHSESASFTCPCDSKSPAMSGQQKHGGADTYARRYSLTAILGITTADEDTDGAEMLEYVTDEQAAELADLAEHPNVDTAAFLKWIGADDCYTIRAGQYETAKSALKRKRGEA